MQKKLGNVAEDLLDKTNILYLQAKLLGQGSLGSSTA